MDFNKINSPENLLVYMNEHIKYGFIDKDGKKYYDPFSEEWNDWYKKCIVQTGKEVLKSEIGTCWDQVELERLWFNNHNYIIKTIFIWFEAEYENNYPTHTFLLYKKKSKWYWFEHAFEKYRGIHEFDSVKDAIDYVISKHLQSSLVDDNRKRISFCEYSKIDKPVNVNDFINHIIMEVK